jgi:hypothetical protein
MSSKQKTPAIELDINEINFTDAVLIELKISGADEETRAKIKDAIMMAVESITRAPRARWKVKPHDRRQQATRNKV